MKISNYQLAILGVVNFLGIDCLSTAERIFFITYLSIICNKKLFIHSDIKSLELNTLKLFFEYFKEMEHRGKLPHLDFECLAMTILSSTFGFTFLNASFAGSLSTVSREQYIKQSVQTFIQGIPEQG